MTQIVTSVEVVRVPELPELLAKPESSYLIIYNPSDGKTYKILESLLAGGASSVPNWTPAASFDTGELCIFNLKIWSSKTDGNTGNTPIEGTYWEEVSKSLAGYTPLWAAGVFDVDRSEVMVYDSGSDKYNLYVLRAPAPFTSSNFSVELAAGSWQLVGGTGGTGGDVASNVSLTPVSGFVADDVQEFADEIGSDVVGIRVTSSTLQVIGGVATIDLSTNRSYGLVQLSSPTEIDIDLLTRKDQRTATLALYPQGNAVTFNANLINAGSETIDTAKQNDLLIGSIGAVTMYKILRASVYSDPQLFAPVITMTALSESSLRVSWSDSADNIDTEIQLSADGVSWGASISLGADTASYDLTGLTVGTTRYARVRFIGDGSIHTTSNWSNTASATTSVNQAPTVSGVVLTSSPSDWQVGNSISVSYIYNDAESNAENVGADGTKYKINIYDSEALANADTDGTGGTVVFSGITGGSPSPDNAIINSMVGKYPVGWIQPVALGGTTTGVWTKSNVGSIVIARPISLRSNGTSDFINTGFNLSGLLNTDQLVVTIQGADLVAEASIGWHFGSYPGRLVSSLRSSTNLYIADQLIAPLTSFPTGVQEIKLDINNLEANYCHIFVNGVFIVKKSIAALSTNIQPNNILIYAENNNGVIPSTPSIIDVSKFSVTKNGSLLINLVANTAGYFNETVSSTIKYNRGAASNLYPLTVIE